MLPLVVQVLQYDGLDIDDLHLMEDLFRLVPEEAAG